MEENFFKIIINKNWSIHFGESTNFIIQKLQLKWNFTAHTHTHPQIQPHIYDDEYDRLSIQILVWDSER